MHILVLGAGAVGLAIAAKLSGVADVTAVTRQQPAGVIATQGLHLEGAWGDRSYRFPCTGKVPPGTHYDYILVTTKAYNTRDICQSYAGLIRDSEVVSLQNGLGSEEIIREYTDHVIGCVVMSGFIRTGQNHIMVTADAGETLFGRFPSGTDHAVSGLASLFSDAGIQARTTADIRQSLWSKNLISCTLNPLSAVLGVRYGLLTMEPCWRVIAGITREVYSVAEAEGIQLLWETPAEYLAYLKEALIPAMATHTSSMLQDIRSGRRTEIMFMNGAITRYGTIHGIATPYNECLTNMVLFQEQVRQEMPT